jgi:hypothetical protein
MEEREVPQTQEKEGGGRVGVSTQWSIPLEILNTIEQAKTNYLLSISTHKNMIESANTLDDLLGTMGNLISQYFDEPLHNFVATRDYKDSTNHNFKHYTEILNSVVKYKANAINTELLRKISRNAFAIWDYYTKKLHIILPTAKRNPKKNFSTDYIP